MAGFEPATSRPPDEHSNRAEPHPVTGGKFMELFLTYLPKATYMKVLADWLNEYGESHQNGVNKAIHWICVPLILWSVLMLLWSIPTPEILVRANLNFAYIAMMAALVYYVFLSPALGLGMLLVFYLLVYLTNRVMLLYTGLPLWGLALIIFTAAWIGQFIGHKIEGKKPSFLKDVQFLLIGPIWLLHFIYKKLGIPY